MMRQPPHPNPTLHHDDGEAPKADIFENLNAAKARGELNHSAYTHDGCIGRKMPANMMPELRVACVWDANKDQSWGLPMHCNGGVGIGCLTRGNLDFIADNTLYRLKAGDLIVTCPWQPYQIGNPRIEASRMHWLIVDAGVQRPGDLWKWPDWINFTPGDLQRLSRLLSHNTQVVRHGNTQIERCFEKIADYVQSAIPPETIQTRLQLYINELFVELLEILQTAGGTFNIHPNSTRRRIEIFLRELNAHLDYPWRLEDMARHCNMGRSRFAHYCKRITNMTATEYLTHCRVEKAKQLLSEQSDSNMLDIALECGFESSQYFATVFRKKTGRTPTLYRHRHAVPVLYNTHTA